MTLRKASLFRSLSVSSMRKMKTPPVWRAYSQLNNAVRALPMWKKPVGLGAKRTRTLDMRNGQLEETPEACQSLPAREISSSNIQAPGKLNAQSTKHDL